MAIRYPNRTGETGTYSTNSPHSVVLDDSALDGMRTFDDAASAGKLSDGDYVGITIRDPVDPAIWAVWIAEYDPGYTDELKRIEGEDSSGTFTNGHSVEVFATLTAKMLDSASLSYTLPSNTGPDWWMIDSGSTDWNPTDQCYEFTGGTGTLGDTNRIGLEAVSSGVNADWGVGLAPTEQEISLEVFIPADATTADFSSIQIGIATYNPSGGAVDEFGATLGTGAIAGDWNTLTFGSSSYTALTSIRYLSIENLVKSGATYKVRNIRLM